MGKESKTRSFENKLELTGEFKIHHYDKKKQELQLSLSYLLLPIVECVQSSASKLEK